MNKLFENGSLTSTVTSYCTLTQMVPTDLILEAYDRLEHSPAAAVSAANALSLSVTGGSAAPEPSRMP